MSNFWLFKGKGPRTDGQTVLPLLRNDFDPTDPAGYIATDGAMHAVNVALALGRPLLVTGEAGTGKTQLAYRVAWELTPDYPKPLRFQMKARTDGSDLFYRYDALRHFQDVQRKQEMAKEKYLRIEALGEAILRASLDRAAALQYLGPGRLPEKPVRSVVLIDEIDKAPRDLPNDILAEIEDMAFEITETGDRFKADPQYRPMVLLTSNSERDLPDAFLRRCVYHHIEPPTREQLRAIVLTRVKPSEAFSPAMLENALIRYDEIRKLVSKKKPSTDELIAWVSVLDQLRIDPLQPKDGQREALAFTLSILLKDSQDLQNIRGE
ncbi:MAG TPA: MoxR family ATPase [Bryobacteraceae bacterium]|jgi:MoxR-like ATPase|nr:MoxR family ATPase [Bryobacteraceae bacterium]